MVKAEKLNVFVDSVVAFFEQIGVSLTDIDTPYLNENQDLVSYDYSGVISISGPLKGCVYVSASTTMLRSMLRVLEESDDSIILMKDLLGEIANTVAGNARTEFGSDFIISTPKVTDDLLNSNHLPRDKRSYIIPFHWRGSDALIGICLT